MGEGSAGSPGGGGAGDGSAGGAADVAAGARDTAAAAGLGGSASAHTAAAGDGRSTASAGLGGPAGAQNVAGDDASSDAPNFMSAARYLAWLYSPEPQQAVLGALGAIESEVAGSLRPGIDHQVAHAKLQWWGQECERCARGTAVHPLARQLAAAFTQALGTARADSSDDVSRASFVARVAQAATVETSQSRTATETEMEPAVSGLRGVTGFVDTAVWDLASATFETRKELTAYCERWATAMFETASRAGVMAVALAASPGGAQTASMADHVSSSASAQTSRWRKLGAAVREVELMVDMAREAHAGRLRVPLDELERAGIDTNSVAKPPWPAPLAAFLRDRHEALRSVIAESVKGVRSEEQARLRGLLVWASLAWQSSTRAQRALPDVVEPRRYHALADGWRAWRAARRAAAGNFRLD